ncbi:MAG: AAA domain-containing protein, partial [Clostridiales bacterium]|nr:AAA domain-containing protein [Clostridiales bacterium]
PALEKEIDSIKESASKAEENRLLREQVDEGDIREVISDWTGIPVDKLAESEKEKLLNLPEILHRRVVGQDEAIDTVSEAIIRARAGLKNENRPIGSFIFMGPTGVGKTEVAKALCEALFDTEKNLIRIDMSEYMEKHSVSRLVGAPPGYVGYDEGGQLTEAVRRKPYSVVLFDEIEKAHPDVFNILLQLLDDGRLTDNQGRTVDFKNTIIIMTSNLPQKDLTSFFRPEFINRIDDIINFESLTKEQISKIVGFSIKALAKRLEERDISVEINDEAVMLIADEAYDPIYGARPVKRYIQKNIENEIAKMVISGDIGSGSIVYIDTYNGKLNYKVR